MSAFKLPVVSVWRNVNSEMYCFDLNDDVVCIVESSLGYSTGRIISDLHGCLFRVTTAITIADVVGYLEDFINSHDLVDC